MIPFAPPRIDQAIIDEVIDTLKSGWITTGPKTKLFEKKLAEYCNVENVLCLNSATAGLELMLRWFGVKQGDEVIIPAYTYSATANVIIHCGAKPVLVDINEHDFNISINNIKSAINSKTKVIMPVDFAGFPCDYDELNQLIVQPEIIKLFNAEGDVQKKLGRILILSDAAHSFGALYNGKRNGAVTDVSVFSFHAVKNLTTAEGGAVALNLPAPFSNQEVYDYLCIFSLHGQNKDALAKLKKGNWKYDIIEAGYKCNMTDISASIGLVELSRYNETLEKRKWIFETYNNFFKNKDYAILPISHIENKTSSYHLYTLRIKNITEQQRDTIIQEIFNDDVSVNVHFIPIPQLSYYKNLGYDIHRYPITYKCFSTEISLPVFYNLTEEQIKKVTEAVEKAVIKITKNAGAII